jgi:hypothetical protein
MVAMAWNPSPEVAVARDAAMKLGADQVILIAITYDKDQVAAITYGKTKKLCDHAKAIGGVAYESVMSWLEETA